MREVLQALRCAESLGHFEQNVVVTEHLACHRAGKRLLYPQTTPEMLADAMVGQLGRERVERVPRQALTRPTVTPVGGSSLYTILPSSA